MKMVITNSRFEEIVRYIVKQGVSAISSSTSEEWFEVDYVAIFAKDNKEYVSLVDVSKELGAEKEIGESSTGCTFLLNKPIKTEAGEVYYVKIRKPDKTRPQRGAPDFKIKSYKQFKKNYLMSSGNFTLMIRKDYEMIELKGVDVLVYFPNKLLSDCNY